jgi:CHAD domain-containing protein
LKGKVTSSTIENYLETLQRTFRKYYYKVLDQQQASYIHKLRLAIKKLRAFLLLVEKAGDKNFNKKNHYLMFSPIFKSAGKVRELQINLELLEKTQTKPKFIQRYKEQLFEAKNKLLTEMNEFDLDQYKKYNKKLSKKIIKIPTKKMYECALSILFNELNLITKIHKNNPSNLNLHKSRIHLRKAKEMLVLLKKISTIQPPKKMLKYINHLYQELGDWHDQIVYIKSLKSIRDEESNLKNPMTIEALIKSGQQKEQNMKTQINQTLNKFFLSKKINKLHSEIACR